MAGPDFYGEVVEELFYIYRVKAWWQMEEPDGREGNEEKKIY